MDSSRTFLREEGAGSGVAAVTGLVLMSEVATLGSLKALLSDSSYPSLVPSIATKAFPSSALYKGVFNHILALT